MTNYPTSFISYSWEDDEHKKWVKDLASRLRQDGVDVRLDQWEVIPGDQLPSFMEKSIREIDYVLIICTPKYKRKSDNREGGVGYEGDIITGEVFQKQNHRKFIPILRKGVWNESAPSWISGKYYVDLRNITVQVIDQVNGGFRNASCYCDAGCLKYRCQWLGVFCRYRQPVPDSARWR